MTMSKRALLLLSVGILAATVAGYIALRPAGVKAKASSVYGRPIDPQKGQVVSLAELFADPAKYSGKNVIVQGEVGQVCQSSGCWLILTDGTNQLFVQFYDFTVRLGPGTRIKTQGEIRIQNKAPFLAGSGLEVVG